VPEGGYLYDDHDEEDSLYSYNDLPDITKIQISLHMAEALADLHGYSGGIIVHQDIVRKRRILIFFNATNMIDFLSNRS
ncbi:MAG: hypothetical protein ACI8RD_012411, partial [Bacillariaceae sp.]|jgi:hypothetical protein